MRKRFQIRFNKPLIISFFILITIVFLSLGYASFRSAMNIENLQAMVRINHDIRVTGVTVDSANNGLSNYEDYNKTSIFFGVSLPTSSSSVKYKVKVTNFGNVKSGILKIDGLPNVLDYSLEEYTLKEQICDSSNNCLSGMEKEFYITIKYKAGSFDNSNTDYNVVLDFDFEPIFTVSLNSDNGDTTNRDKEVMYKNTYGTLYTPTKVGNSFQGWFLNGEQITENSTVLTANNHTLTALWEKNQYTVTFNPNGGSTSTLNKTVAYGDTYGDLPTPTRSGYDFDGWYTTSGSGGIEVTSSTTLTNASNHTLYAHWTEKNMIVTFNANGGSTSTSSKTVTYNKTYGTLPTPTRSGYTFDGWYTSVSSTTKITSSTKVTKTSNHTLYAHWNASCDMDAIIAKLGITYKSGSPNFSTTSTSNEGVYTLPDDYGTSYYYRGTVTNNYIKFAGFYWRIIRVNGDGSIRVIYDGKQGYANGVSDSARSAISSVQWNSVDNDVKYAGYMYGSSSGSVSQAQTNTNNSIIKTQLENWYATNIVTPGYSSYVVDRIFCNDRKVASGSGYGRSVTNYAPKSRIVSSKTPSFICSQKNDAFTVSDTTKGNGKLSYPVGLITADEISAAGGVFGTYNSSTNSSYYLQKGHYYWSMSPAIMDSGYYLYNLSVADKGNIDYRRVNNTAAIAPVINLSLDYACSFTGTGSRTDPFREVGVSP